MKQKIYIYLLILMGGLFSACNSWLDVTPEDAISDEDLFATGFGFRNSLNGIYANLGSEALYGRELSWGFLSAISQQYNQTTKTDAPLYSDAAALLYQTVETEPVVTAIWEKGYQIIANLNKLLEKIQQTDSSLFEYGTEEKNLIQAEAQALRAWMHFDLLRLFAPAPATKPEGVYLPYRDTYQNNLSEKLGVKEYLEKVMKDLAQSADILKHFDTEVHPKAMFASNMYTPTPEWNARYRFLSSMFVDEMGIFFWSRGYRVNYLALLGLQARVYLYAGPEYYKNAEVAAGELYQTFYQQKNWIGFTEENHLMCELESRYTKASHDVLMGVYNKRLAQDYELAVWQTSTTGSTTKLPLADIPNLFASDHGGVYTDYRMEQLLGTTNETHPKYYSLKFLPSAEAVVNEMENPMIPLIRFSEVCHILAELSAYNGRLSEGINYLQTVRKARGAERSLSLTVHSQQELMQEILLDIRKENLGEGGTFFTYKRWNLSSIPGAAEEGNVDMRGKYVLPIPASESIN